MKLTRGAFPIEELEIIIEKPRSQIEEPILMRNRLPFGLTPLTPQIEIEQSSLEKTEELIANSYGLTPREIEVYRLIRKPMSNPQIGKELGIVIQTTKFHVGNILRKMGMSNRYELIVYFEKCERENYLQG